MLLKIARHYFTVAEFERIGEAKIFREYERLELIEGEIFERSTISKRRASCVKRLNTFLYRRLGRAAVISAQEPIQINDYSETQPDIALLKWRDDLYEQTTPTVADILLIIEVSDTTAEYDRLVKVPLYAKAGIKEVWLVDLPAEQIEVYAEPAGGEYQITRQIKRDEELQAQTIPNLVISAGAVLE